ncbi:MAG TPA: ASCH domain-containing protein, partial [Candidatus Polarisedimenticolia bacterium]|nr:ASCH domain-containing protein [Candidatus Polarisedimenticolia bacterium]
MRQMAFTLTVDAVKQRRKTVTRRDGWEDLKPGDRLAAMSGSFRRKKKSAPDPVQLAVIEVVDVRVEPLDRML